MKIQKFTSSTNMSQGTPAPTTLFSGIVGLPLEPEDAQKPAQAPVDVAVMDPEPMPAVEAPFAKKRGRPPKNAAAMTPAERKTASRENQKRKEQDAERERIITALEKMYWLPNRRSLLQGVDFSRVPTEKLREALEDTPVEFRGRLWGEQHTKEKTLERIAVEKERGGRRVRPKGRGPNS